MANRTIPKTAIPHSQAGVLVLSTTDGFDPLLSIVALNPGDTGEYVWTGNDILCFKSSSLGAVLTLIFGPVPQFTQYGATITDDVLTFVDMDRCRFLRLDSQYVGSDGKVHLSYSMSATDTIECGVLTF